MFHPKTIVQATIVMASILHAQEAIVSGLTTTGGNADAVAPHEAGGHVKFDQCEALITDCVITRNSAQRGGGIHADSSRPTIFLRRISGNETGSGGALGLSGYAVPLATNCLIDRNRTSYWGGGLRGWHGKAVLQNSRLVDAPAAPDSGHGSAGVPRVDRGAFEFRPGDCTHDGHVDGDDLAGLVDCLHGPTASVRLGCTCFDIDADWRVDLIDWALVQNVWTGD